jgi:hypothetical protein
MMADNDVQRVMNMLHEMHADLAVIKATVGKMDHAVNGNGKPGLIDRMTIIEERQSSCPARKALSEGSQSNRIGAYALGLSVVVAIVEIIGRVFP